MRIVAALLVCFFAPAVLAQPCDPAVTDEVCPDTTDWHRYFPLDVGNVWQYENARFTGEPVTFSSWAITGEAEVEGQAYVEFERCDEADDGSAICDEPLLLRYDDEHELVLRRTDDGDVWWDVLPCELGAAFNTGATFDEFTPCTGPAEGIVPMATQGAYGATVAVPPDEVTGDTRKSVEMYPGTGPELYAGLGVTQYFYDLMAEPMRLVYAHVDGEQVGTPAFASCDPLTTQDVPCPDTTDWRSYYPLEFGNQWQYEFEGPCSEGEICQRGREVVGSETVDGVEYFLIRNCRKESEGDVVCTDPVSVHYDDVARTVVIEGEDGTLYDYLYACDLAAPFNLYGEVACGTADFPDPHFLQTTGRYDGVFDLGAGSSLEGSTKSFGGLFGGTIYFAGIGRTYSVGDAAQFGTELVYARIDGVEYGTPAFVFPTSSEPGGAQPVATAFTTAFPNPARGAMQAQYTLAEPQTVTLELIDVLGRRVRETEVGPQVAGPHDVRIDLSGLRAGLYVLRLRAEAGVEATRRVVVVQ